MNYYLELHLAIQDAERFQKEKADSGLQKKEPHAMISDNSNKEFEKMISGIVSSARRPN